MATEHQIQLNVPKEKPGSAIPVFTALILISGCLFLFWPLLFCGEQLAYRDADYLYYPLFNFIQSEWVSGEIPLWNPYCGIGQPLLADGSSSVFYPGKFVFFATFFSFTTRFGIYVVAHILIGGWGAYFCSRRMQISQIASACAAIVFAFNAPFLSLSNNIVYLVGATWLPWSIACIWSLSNCKNQRFCMSLALGVLWSLMILGGDAQMVYHSIIIGFALLFGEVLFGKTLSEKRSRGTKSVLAAKTALFLLISATIALSLSAIQLLPSMQAMQTSVRSQFDEPRNIYEIPEFLGRNSSNKPSAVTSLFRNPWPQSIEKQQEISHLSDLYQFSLPPWMLAESIAPNILGKAYPINRRWGNELEVLPENNRRSWYPSLYFGVATFVLACCGCRIHTRHEADHASTWMTWSAVWFCLGSFGFFGPMMLFNSWAGGGNEPIGPQVGGVYWIMSVLLPKYILFRYPAKLFVVSCFSLSILAGFGLDRLLAGQCRRKIRVLAFAVGTFAGLALLASIVWQSGIQNLFVSLATKSEADFHSSGSLDQSRIGLIHAILALAVFGLMYLALNKLNLKSHYRSITAAIFLILIAGELLIANNWVIWTSPSGEQRTDSSPSKYHLLTREHNLNSFSSIEQADWSFFISELRQRDDNSRDIILATLSGARDIRVANQFEVVDRLKSNAPALTIERTRFALERMERGITVVETDKGETVADLAKSKLLNNNINSDQSTFVLTRSSSNRFDFDIELATPGMLIVNEQFDFGWHARYKPADLTNEWQAAEILRVNRVMQGVYLPAGNHSLVFEYRPRPFVVGGWVSLISVLLVIAMSCISLRRYLPKSLAFWRKNS